MSHTQPEPESSPLSPADSDIIREGAAPWLLEMVKRDNADLANFMQAFLDCLPADGADTFREDLVKCGDVKRLSEHKASLLSGLLAPLKNKGKTPKASTSPIDDVEMEVESLVAMLHTFDPPKREKVLRKICLKRDDYRCVATGVYDKASWRQLPSKMQQKQVGKYGVTQVAHILPFSLSDTSPGSVDNKARTWTLIHRYFPSVREVTQHYTIDEPSNALTLMVEFHDAFDNFEFYLEPTGTNNVYSCNTYAEEGWGGRDYLREKVELDDHGTNFALPSRALLGLHAAVAKILHISGAGEDIDRVLRDYDEIPCLARDGTTDIGNLLSMLVAH